MVKELADDIIRGSELKTAFWKKTIIEVNGIGQL